MSYTVAALYIDPRGPYRAICWACGLYASCDCDAGALECWDNSRDARLYEGPLGPGWRAITRDARKYDGPHPVVAHPSSKHWGRARHLAQAKCLGCEVSYSPREHDNCPSCGAGSHFVWSDADCAPRAVEQVRRWGGVLEHPAGSKLWEHGSIARLPLPPGPNGGGEDHVGGYTVEVDQCEWGHVARQRTWLYLVGVPRSALEAPPFPGRQPTRYASGGRTPRRRTPPLFAEYLVRLARSVKTVASPSSNSEAPVSAGR